MTAIIVCVVALFCSHVVQQPDPAWIASGNKITQFSLAHNIGLIAEQYSYLGNKFRFIEIGRQVVVIMDNGARRDFKVVDIQRYEALEPENPKSDFTQDGQKFSVEQVFQKMYTSGLTFQTCFDIRRGRLFVIAEPIQ